MFFYPPGFTIVADDLFTVGPYPARLIGWKMEHENRLMFVNHWIVQTPDAFFEFSYGTDRQERAEEILPVMRGVVESFRICAPISVDTSAAIAVEPTA